VGTPGNSISVIDIAKRQERTRFPLPARARAPHGLKLRPEHPEELFTNTEDGLEEMVVLNATNGSVLRTFPLPAGVHNFIFSENGDDLYAFTITDRVLRLSPMDGSILAQAAVPHVRGLSWTSDHSQLLAGGRGEIELLDQKDLRVARTFSGLPVGQTFYPSPSPDGQAFYVPAVIDGVLLVVDANTGEVRKRIATGSPLQVLFDGKYAWVSNVKVPASMLSPGEHERPGGLVRLDLATYQFQSIMNTEDANGIALAP
jgi:hypothetical protein